MLSRFIRLLQRGTNIRATAARGVGRMEGTTPVLVVRAFVGASSIRIKDQ
jgi:hypothetical protein